MTTTLIVVSDTDGLAEPEHTGDNGIVQVDFNVSDYGASEESMRRPRLRTEVLQKISVSGSMAQDLGSPTRR